MLSQVTQKGRFWVSQVSHSHKHNAQQSSTATAPAGQTFVEQVGFRARWQQAGAICSTLLTFWKNSGAFRPGNHQSLELESQQIGREKGPHVTVKCGYAHRFLPFLSLCC